MSATDHVPTWAELEAQGVKRCCAMFKNGKRCRRRASEQFDGSWCSKHGPYITAVIAAHNGVKE
jgi:hypothetical protein